jgi:hypothetical protein
VFDLKAFRFWHSNCFNNKQEGIKMEDILNDKELLSDLEEWNRLKLVVAGFKKLDKKIKGKINGIPKALIGKYLIEGKEIIIPERTIKEVKYWKSNIKIIR